jgi:hypothetical protein
MNALLLPYSSPEALDTCSPPAILTKQSVTDAVQRIEEGLFEEEFQSREFDTPEHYEGSNRLKTHREILADLADNKIVITASFDDKETALISLNDGYQKTASVSAEPYQARDRRLVVSNFADRPTYPSHNKAKDQITALRLAATMGMILNFDELIMYPDVWNADMGNPEDFGLKRTGLLGRIGIGNYKATLI